MFCFCNGYSLFTFQILVTLFPHFPNAFNCIATRLYYKFKSAVNLVATHDNRSSPDRNMFCFKIERVVLLLKIIQSFCLFQEHFNALNVEIQEPGLPHTRKEKNKNKNKKVSVRKRKTKNSIAINLAPVSLGLVSEKQ